jgi:hypothetical protein
LLRFAHKILVARFREVESKSNPSISITSPSITPPEGSPREWQLRETQMNDRSRSNEEAYYRGFIKGYRIGRIQAIRECIIRVLKWEGNSDKKLKRKINFETDIGFLDKVLVCIIEEHKKNTEKIRDFGQIYDTICRSEEEIQNETYTTYKG